MARNVFFDDLTLNDGAPFSVVDYEPQGSPVKTTKLVSIARADGGIRVNEQYESRILTVSGFINCDSESVLDAAIDTLKSKLRTESTLKVQYGGTYRLIDCVCTNLIVPRGPQNISFAPYSIQFEAESPFWYEEGLDYHIVNESITTSTDSFNLSNTATMDAELVFTLQITTISPNVTPVQISIANNSTGQSITVSENIANASTLVIDCKEKQAFLNGALVKARGQFPVWGPGSGVIDYNDDASSRSITINSSNQRRFL